MPLKDAELRRRLWLLVHHRSSLIPDGLGYPIRPSFLPDDRPAVLASISTLARKGRTD